MLQQFKLNVPLRGFKAGHLITLACDEAGTPIDLYWFKRFQEAVTDNCIERVKPKLKDKKDADFQS